MAHKNADLQKIEEIIEIMKKNDLVEVEIKHGDDKILLKRSSPQQPSITAVPVVNQAVPSVPVTPGAAKGPVPPEAIAAVPKDENLVEIKSPMVGTFYATPSPDSDPYVEVGSKVNPRTVVCIIEAMKVMNEIKAETEGEIVEVLATSGQAVEYGQVLFRVKPD